jgi:hypothetical protein
MQLTGGKAQPALVFVGKGRILLAHNYASFAGFALTKKTSRRYGERHHR